MDGLVNRAVIRQLGTQFDLLALAPEDVVHLQQRLRFEDYSKGH